MRLNGQIVLVTGPGDGSVGIDPFSGKESLSGPPIICRVNAGPSMPNGAANARLIAAAPDLLAALKVIVDQIDVMDTRFNDTLPAAFAALEAATGERYSHPCNDGDTQ